MLLLFAAVLLLLSVYILRPVFRRQLAKARHANLASEFIAEGSQSCPDLASSPDTVLDPQTSSESKFSQDTSVETASLRSRRQSTKQRASTKVRQLLGKAKDFRRIATVRMTEVNLQSTVAKRDRSSDSRSSMGQASASVESGNQPTVPSFLTQSYGGWFP